MRFLWAMLFFFVVGAGGMGAIKLLGARAYSRRTGDSMLDSMFGNWLGERLWGVPFDVWLLLWMVLTLAIFFLIAGS